MYTCIIYKDKNKKYVCIIYIYKIYTCRNTKNLYNMIYNVKI